MNKGSFLYRNSLSIVIFLLFLFSYGGQLLTGWQTNNKEREEEGKVPLSFQSYIVSAHSVEATFENWESEFLQIGIYVWLTVFLRQKGSSESKSIDEEEEVDKEPVAHPDAPWPVRKGGWYLKVYKSSLTLVLLLLFCISFIFHFFSSRAKYNEHQQNRAMELKTVPEYLMTSEFWFESFQNWQSEFLSVLTIVVLSIYLRQKGSPESKPVDAPNSKTGK